MCGIVVTTKASPDEAAIAASVRHRGTVAPRFVRLPGVCVCHTLMPVQGATPTAQPVTGAAGTLVFQGELWEHAGYKSDTKFLYDFLANGCTARTVATLNGMFAFVFCRGRTVYFAVDAFGEQPLYYARETGFASALTVASEKKQLRAVGVPLSDIMPCLPGTLYTYCMDTEQLKAEKYHTFNYNLPRCDTWDEGELRDRVAHGVRLKYTANHLQRSALLLSGGVDSAVMAYELSRLGLRDAYTVGTDENSLDFITATVTAKQFGLRLKRVLCRTFDIDASIAVTETRNRSMAEEYVCHLALGRCLADDGVRVVFSGSGADELFCGYSYYLRFHGVEGIQERFIENYHKMDLRILNKVFMNNAVEVRNPFLTTALADYALTLGVAGCLVGPKHEMKYALRESYKNIIPMAHNKKLIANETMGVKAYFEKLYGPKNPRIYYDRYKAIFEDNGRLAECVARAHEVQYEVF